MNADMDADGDARLIALKKNYADAILSTVKEASARIIIAERKADFFQHELNAARDQGVRTLINLKRMMDSKVFEVEMTSSDQQRRIEELTLQLQDAENIIDENRTISLKQHAKIEELEAQLEEAIDIVEDLRREIQYLHSQSKKARIANQRLLEQQNDVGEEEKSLTNTISMSDNASEDPAKIVKGACEKTTSESTMSEIVTKTKSLPSSSINDSIDESDSNKPTLPSIVSEPFRNRRAQSLLEFEEKLIAGELWFRDPIENTNKEVVKTNMEEAVEDWRKTNNRKDILGIVSTRKKKTFYKKPKTSSLRLLAEQAMLIKEASSVADEENHIVDQVDAEVTIKDEMTMNDETANSAFLIKQQNDGTTNLTEKHDAPKAKLLATTRVIKYTYQRRKKKQSLCLNFDGNASSETKTVDKTLRESQNSPMETEFSLSTEFQQNSQHVAQVVHQGNADEVMKIV